jgi:hypothetical protein
MCYDLIKIPDASPAIVGKLIFPMTDKPHHPHDKFVKAIFPLLFPAEIEATQRAVKLKETLFIDIFYKSLTNPNPANPQQEQFLGMLVGKHVYRLDPQTGIGIVVLEKLPYSADTMLLKLLSNDPDTVLRAYRDIERLSADLPLANDIISACNEYCIHIQGLSTESLDPQEVTTMSILQQEPAYQKRVKELQAEGEARGEARGKLETAKKLLSVRFGKVSPELEARLRSMTADDLDDLLIRSLDWTNSKSLFDYLGIPTSPN